MNNLLQDLKRQHEHPFLNHSPDAAEDHIRFAVAVEVDKCVAQMCPEAVRFPRYEGADRRIPAG